MLTDEKFVKNNRTQVVGICENDTCGKRFERDLSYANKMQYCSNHCRGEVRSKNAVKDYTCENENCKKVFQRSNRSKKNRFCSPDCSRESQANKNKTLITCAYSDCSKKLVTTNSKFCSKDCRELQKTKKFRDLKTEFLKKPKDYYKKYLDEKGRYTNCVICEKKLDNLYAQKLFCDRICRIVGKELGIRYTPIFIDKECLSCGETFQEKIGTADKLQKKYCTHDCYLKVNKKAGKRYVSLLDDNAVVFHSMWEMRFAVACDKYNIPWRRYDGDPISTSVGDYYPDFITGINDDIIEIKGYLDSNASIKIASAKEQFGDKYKVLLEEDLKKFEETGKLV